MWEIKCQAIKKMENRYDGIVASFIITCWNIQEYERTEIKGSKCGVQCGMGNINKWQKHLKYMDKVALKPSRTEGIRKKMAGWMGI